MSEAIERRDRQLKLELYSRQGVHEYWMVDWQRKTLEVYRQGGNGLQLTTTLRDGDVLTSPMLPGFSCPVSNLWQPLLGEVGR